MYLMDVSLRAFNGSNWDARPIDGRRNRVVMPHQLSIFRLHCNRPMHGHGRDKGRPRYRCSTCGKVIIDGPHLDRESSSIVNGRPIIYLDKDDPIANRSGWQYTSRVVVSRAVGRVLLSSEHVDHVDTNVFNNDIRNLRLLLNIDHGKHHIYHSLSYCVLGEFDTSSNKFIEYDQPKER